MRVLQVAPTYPPESGGIAVCTNEVTSRLAARGVGVEVLTVDHTGELPRHEVIGGVSVHRARSWPKGADYRLAPGVARHVYQSRCDLVHIQGYQTFVAPIAMLAATVARIPYVLTFHGGGHSSRLRHASRGAQLRVLRPLLARAAHLVVTADWEVDHYSKRLDLGRARFVVIPNGGDLPRPDASGSEGGPPLVASLGRVERYKGHHRVLAALPEVLRQHHDAKVWIAGDGPYVPELREQARALGVAEHVEIRGVGDRQEYANRLANASVAVLLSEFESHPMAVLEAITLGVPTLVADDGAGLSELANKGFARSVPLDDTAAHASAMLDLLRDPPPRRELVLPSWDRCVDELLKLYKEICGPCRAERVERPAEAQSARLSTRGSGL